MRHIAGFATIALTLIVALSSSPAQAQRVFVAAQGSDSNPCTFAAPCRTFQHAHDTVAAGGEIDVLDPAGYGTLTITKAISIQGHGFAGIGVASGATGVTVNATSADVVSLNGLLIEGNGVGLTGIMFNVGKSLIIENCVVHNVFGAGIQFSPGAATTMSVSNTVVSDIGNTAIQVAAGGNGAVTVSLSRVEVYNNIYGIYVTSGSGGPAPTNVTITDSVVAGSSAAGVISQTEFGVSVMVMVRGSALIYNATGCTAISSGAVLRLAQSTLTGNTTSWSSSLSGSVRSYSDNYIDGNGDGDPVPPAIAKK